MKNLKPIVVWILSLFYLVTFYLLGLILYYLSKVFKILGHLLMFETYSVRSELKDFSKHFTSLGDI